VEDLGHPPTRGIDRRRAPVAAAGPVFDLKDEGQRSSGIPVRTTSRPKSAATLRMTLRGSRTRPLLLNWPSMRLARIR
jgi:hypothetical protein